MTTNNYNGLISTAEKYGATVLLNEPMKNYTSFKIGGACDIMIKINCEALLIELMEQCKSSDIKYYIIGRGSNILVSDKGLSGAVLLLGSDFSSARVENDVIECKAGASLSAVCRLALANSLKGLEFAYGIPGSIGGAVYMNAGAYGGEMKDVVLSVKYIENGTIKELPLSKLELSYRHSYFTGKNLCITSVKLKLSKGDKHEIEELMESLMNRRREKQPLEYPSAGSTFKRPAGDYAGRLIEVCGLKGTACGGAEVSTKHSGFVINKNNATFEDVMGVIRIVQETVKKETGVDLEREVLVIE